MITDTDIYGFKTIAKFYKILQMLIKQKLMAIMVGATHWSSKKK
jgi:hypothetical protein